MQQNAPASIPEPHQGICSQIQKALEDTQEVFEKVTEPIADTSCLGKSEGIGLFLYVRDKQAAVKQQYPQSTDHEIVRILLAQWEKLSDAEKQEYLSKGNINKLNQTKKQKKMLKMIEKLVQSTEKGASFYEDEGSSQSLSFGTKTKSKNFEIEEEEEEYQTPKKKMATTSLVFAQDRDTVQQKQIATPNFQKLEFDVIHQNKKEEEKVREEQQRAMDKAVDQNLMEVEQCLEQKASEPSPELNEQGQLKDRPKDSQEIAPLQNIILSSSNLKEQKANEQQQPQKPQDQRQICASENPRQIPPRDDIVEVVSNQLQSTKQCDTCFGAQQAAVQGTIDQNRDMIDSPVLIQCPSQSNSLPLPQRSRDSQTQQEKPSQPKVEHHEKCQTIQNQEKEIATKFEVPEVPNIDDAKPTTEHKQDNQNDLFDQKGQNFEGNHENVSKQSNGNTVEIPQLLSFQSLKPELLVEDVQKQSRANMNEQDEKLINMEVKQDNTCTQQQEQLELE